MLNGERSGGVTIITVPARFGETYAAWLPNRSVIVVAADSAEDQLTAIARLIDRLFDLAARRDRTPTRSE